MMYVDRPNHIGIEIGEVISYNPNKGHVKVKLSDEIDLGDSIAINNSSCKVSELMIGNNNIKNGKKSQIVTIGRIKGKIFNGNRVYKTVSEKVNNNIDQYILKENIKRDLDAKIYIKEKENIKLELEDRVTGIKVIKEEDVKASKADNNGISIERVKEQLSKTGNTPFNLANIEVVMDDNVILPISSLNSLRRNAIEELESKIVDSFKREQTIKLDGMESIDSKDGKEEKNTKVTLCLNTISDDIDYSNLENIDNVYIPFKYFIKQNEKVDEICNTFNTYVLLPNISKGNYERLIKENLEDILSKNVKGIVISNLSHLEFLNSLKGKDGLEIIANYTLNITNNETINELKKASISKYIVSPEDDKEEIRSLGNDIEKEVIVYGRSLLMTTEYCLIGKPKDCKAPCMEGKYELKDRMGFNFPVYTDRISCNNLIYNSKITSILWKDLNTDSIRIDILDETEKEIKDIVNKHIKGDRLEGENYTNGNLNREI